MEKEINQKVLHIIQEAKNKRLSEVNLSGMNLTFFPKKLLEIESLTKLDLSYNQISELPNSIYVLENLIELNLSANYLSTLPSHFSLFDRLETLNLSINQFDTFPIELFELKSLKNLNFSNNNLSTISDTSKKPNFLENLDFSNNELDNFPNIFYLKHLQTINLLGNNISNIPSDILEIKKLKKINLYKNPIVEPPQEIINQGLTAIFNYFEEKSKGYSKVYEAKLIIVGEPGAGKTTLVHKLLDITNENPREKDFTKGIDIVDWTYVYNGHKTKIHIWDFGGQQILKATHSFFMNRGAVFVLLADSRSDNTDYFDWLYRIETFAGNSPVILVHNEHDDRPKEINMNQLSQRFPEIQSPLRCNLAKVKMEERGNEFNEVVNKIQDELAKLDVMGQELPKSWRFDSE